jgi:hypothetical protein
VNLVIADRIGVVHRVFDSGASCSAVERAPRTVPVTPLQCLVYGLAGCGKCFPQVDGYDRIVRGRAA